MGLVWFLVLVNEGDFRTIFAPLLFPPLPRGFPKCKKKKKKKKKRETEKGRKGIRAEPPAVGKERVSGR